MSLHLFGFCALNDQGHHVCPGHYIGQNGTEHVCSCPNHEESLNA